MAMEHPEIGKENLLQAWRHRYRHLSDTQEQLRRAAFSLIRSGCIATDQRLADHLGFPIATVEEELSTLEDEGLIVVRDPGGVVGIYGLSLTPTPHALCLDGQALFTWCALDAVGIPSGLAVDATIQAPCAQCRQDLNLSFEVGQVAEVSTDTLCLWVVEPGQGRSAVGDT